jgi:hypothetical protein
MPPAAPPSVFVLRHTHWDREWYHPASRFRKRLVDLIDGLLGTQPNAPFLLDGQAIVLRDYVDVRPERAAELATALGAHLEAGPWYVLADELIPSGEALVRNLLAGRRVLRGFRATAPPVLYSPDSFGHPATLPALAAGFGYRTVIVWRGYGSRRFPPGDSARWRAPSGDEVLLFHLPPDGYEFGSHLPVDDAQAALRWAHMRRVLEPRSALGIWFVPLGADHHAPQPDERSALAALVRAASPVPVQVGSLAHFARMLEARAQQATLPVVQGELRDSYGYTWTLGGTLATRAHQKRMNAHVERDLVRDVEPWAAMARMRGSPSLRHHLNSTWELLLSCHPHDSLCGCSTDAVSAAVDERMQETTALVEELRNAATGMLIGHDPNAARQQPAAWTPAIVVRNRAPRPRSGIAHVEIDLEVAMEPVGPGSAGRRKQSDGRGELGVPTQILSRERVYSRIEAPSFYPINYEVERQRALAWVEDVPAYGTSTLPLGDTRSRPASPIVVRGDARGVASDAGKLTIGAKGLRWQSSAVSRAIHPLFEFETVGDRGDAYTHSAIPKSQARGVLRRSRVKLRGPLRAAIDSAWSAAPRGTGRSGRAEIETRASLDAGADFVRVSVTGVNRAPDQRLRIVFQTGLRPRRVFADAAFALIERKPLRVPVAETRAEWVPPTAPLHRFVTLFDGARGCTIVSDGLAEYEVLGSGAVAITLVRAVAELSRGNLPERPGHAGWPVPTPAAQCLGPFAAEFAIAWHAGDSQATRAHITALVEDALLPLTGDTRRDLVTLPPPIEGIALAGEGLTFSALKESDDGNYVVARCVNISDVEVHGAWVLPRAPGSAHVSRLDETPIAPLPMRGNRVPIVVAPHAIHTVLFGPDDGGELR